MIKHDDGLCLDPEMERARLRTFWTRSLAHHEHVLASCVARMESATTDEDRAESARQVETARKRLAEATEDAERNADWTDEDMVAARAHVAREAEKVTRAWRES